MKNTKICPKCDSNRILMVPGRVLSDGAGNFIAAGIFRYAKVDRYVCTNCGFTEEWIATKNDIDKLRKKFDK